MKTRRPRHRRKCRKEKLTKEGARAKLNRMGKASLIVAPVRMYECEQCGNGVHHITSQPKRKKYDGE